MSENLKYRISFPNDYNPSIGSFHPYLSEELENIVEKLKIDSLGYKISSNYQENILIAVIDCLIYYHYNSIDVQFLKNFFFEFNEKLCENLLDLEDLEVLWAQQTGFIETISDEEVSFEISQKITREFTKFESSKEKIVKRLKIICESLRKEQGFLDKQVIIDKIVKVVTLAIPLSKEQIQKLLPKEDD